MVHTRTSVFHEYAEQVREEVEAALTEVVKFGAGCPNDLKAAIEHSLLAPCKRLRPLLVLMSAEACGSTRGQAMPAACAVELVHTYSLVHDDLPAMDNDSIRRGRPSCHIAFGEATAILAGDALLALAFEVLATRVKPPDIAVRCCRELAQAAGPTALVGGQMDDLNGNSPVVRTVPGRELDRLQSIHERKTGALFRTCLRLGALIAGAENELLTRLDTYGRRVGMAFQIIDDLLDARGNAKTLGKSVGKDADQGKLTFPRILGIDQSRQQAVQHIEAACQELAPLGADAERLQGLAQYILERNR